MFPPANSQGEVQANMPKPIEFCCTAVISQTPQEIAALILDVEAWTSFRGYGPIPAIQRAEFLVRTAEAVGSRIQVHNTDGSKHVEEIVAWDPERSWQLVMQEFSPPLSRLAAKIEERWELEPSATGTRVARRFRMFARSGWSRLALIPISWFLRRAIARHLEQMARVATATQRATSLATATGDDTQ
jgi:hypothetical protein